MSDVGFDPLLERLLKLNEETASKFNSLSNDIVEVKTIVAAVAKGQVLERIARIEARMNIAFTAGTIGLTTAFGMLAKMIWGSQ